MRTGVGPWSRLWRQIRGLRGRFDRPRREQDLDDELQAYLEDLTTRNVARGMTADAARRAALVEVGGVQQVREATRDVWRFASVETLLHDVRYGFRLLGRAPGFACVVVATLGLVIGANATVFSVMHAVLWRPLPYADAERLVIVDADARNVRNAGISGGEAIDLRQQPNLFDGLAYVVGVDAHVNVDGEMERVNAVSATDDALHLMGAVPLALGRPLDSSRDGGLTSTIRSVVISHRLWEQRLASDPNAVGRVIEVNNIDAEIVGVLRPDFRVYLPANAVVPEQIDVWFPTGWESDRRSRGQATIARLAPGVSLVDAQARLDVLADVSVREYPSDYGDGGLRFSVAPLDELLTADVRGALWALAGAVFFVLIIGCVNVGNLMLSRSRARAREMAVRRALGAAQRRLFRQLFTEAAILCALGGGLGVLVAEFGVSLVEWLGPTHLPRQSTITVNGEVAAFIGGVAVLSTLAFALIPALTIRGAALDPLRAGRADVQVGGVRRLQRALMIAEVALSIVPLVAGGLMLRTFANLTSAPLGFEPTDVLTAKIAYRFRSFPETADKVRLHEDAFERIRQIPGVEDVSAGGPLPFDDFQPTRAYAREGEPTSTMRATIQSVFPGFLRVTGTRLLAGREFTREDISASSNVIVIDARVAEQLWPGESAIGKRLAYQRGVGSASVEVIGVSEPVRTTRVTDRTTPHLFVPFHFFTVEQALVIKTREPASIIGPQVKQAVESLGTRRPVHDIRALGTYVDASITDSRFITLVLTGFGMASILLAAIGLYGTLGYLTSLRTQEFGVRMALGASTGRVLRTVLSEGLVLAGVGAVVGFAGAVATTHLLQGLLYDVTPFDGVTLVAVVSLVAATAVLAALLPAWRASRVNPSLVLRAGE